MDDMPLTRDAYLGGRLALWQPAKGYRAGIDPVLLAAACPAEPGQSVLELGCGTGTASLCLAARVSGLALTGVERQPEIAALARRNAAENGVEMNVVEADLAHLPPGIRQRSFDHVIANPPYFRRENSHASPHGAREAAMGEETPLALWIATAARRLATKGWLTLIHRPERLADLLGTQDGLGSVQIQPLQPREGRDASLVIVRLRKGGRAPLRLHAPLVLHRGRMHEFDGEDYSEEITAVLRGGAALPAFGAAAI
ncbi:tRNA1(Val) (adenine(37)-N6)-methyltransferase [Tropicimonas sp. IMCC6043]|uniref:tRNA1(Val) (adenine(37)-N6)-methyltransferase n=1 Tax=Tropicimonas sp. IMCC6043 TaxID=2510645 RepID=UPI00101B9B45|nr:methyltransferase domain-containing protein [Tropicimonas sp. IMCC6043]RYH08229.1 methyltransferase domain-containing protein [Tropicimonas sp. IMCC6043]